MLGQVPFAIHQSMSSGDLFGPAVPIISLSFAYLAMQFAVVCRVLIRGDLDAQNKILWVLVTMFVPLGFVLYLVLAPAVVPLVVSPRRDTPGRDVSGTPWAGNPGHSRRT